VNNKEFKLKTHPADFEIIYSGIRSVTLEMGITMERTARAPIYFAAHDFSTAVFDGEGKLVSLSEFIPIHIGAAPFAIKAAIKYFGNDIMPGDVIITNDPYTFDAGNHLADWTILLPVFYQKKLWFWSVNRAHQMDVGGGQSGAYNPNAHDIFAEGVRIPPIKIIEKGKLRKDVFDFILANVRFPESQRGDLWSMIGSARVGEKRLVNLLNMWGTSVMDSFLDDLYNYTEFLMRTEIEKIPEGTYSGEAWSDGSPGAGPAVAIRCKTTIKDNNISIDLSDSDSMIDYYINSTLANTHSSVLIALMTSIGRNINFRSEGIMRPVKIKTKPGTLAHATYPAPVGLCTLYVAKQIIEAVWDSLAKVVPERVSAGWGGFAAFIFSGVDPRRNEGFASPDFLATAAGAGAIWGTDGWHAGGSPISSGGLYFPEIEICESKYPMLWKRWEIIKDSGGAGRWRGGCGMESTFVLEGDEIDLCHQGEHYRTLPRAISGGKQPPKHTRQVFVRSNGKEEEGGGALYKLYKGEILSCYCQGGCGVGDPLDRDVKSVQRDLVDEIISIESARDLYGVVINSTTFKVDEAATKELRLKKRRLKDRRRG